MDSVYMNLVSKVTTAGQLQLLRFWSELDAEEKLKLADQILELDLETLNKQFKEAHLRKPIDGDTKPLDDDKIGSSVTSSEEERKTWRGRGLEAVGKNEVGVILLSGGQGTRLGSDEAKALYDIGLPSKKSLLQIQAEKIQRLESLSGGGTIAWYIMTSESTEEDIRDALIASKYFGLKEEQVKLFPQDTLPCLSDEGDILLINQSTVARSPDGNGGLVKALKEEGILADMKLRKLKHVFVCGVDNVLVKVADPEFLGYCIDQEAECGNKVVRRVDGEHVGVTCLIDGKPGVVEYTEMCEEMRDAVNDDAEPIYKAANICAHYFSLEFLTSVVEKEELMPVHVVRKKIPHVTEAGNFVEPDLPSGVKLEKFIFDVFQFADPDKFVMFECDRDEEFAPLKNASGPEATPESCLTKICRLHTKWILAAGAELVGPDGDSLTKEDLDNNDEEDVFKKNMIVEVSPKVSYAGEDLEKIVHGKMLSWPLYLTENKQYF